MIGNKVEIRPFEDCIKKVKYTNKVAGQDFKSSGRYPIVSQEEAFISGYWDNPDDVFHIDGPVVIFGDHSRHVKYVDFDFVIGADGVKILAPVDDINAKFFYYYLKSQRIQSLGYSRHYKVLKEKMVPVPSLADQQRIVAELDLLSSIVEKKNAQLKTLDDLAQSIFYEMFGDVEEKTPLSTYVTELSGGKSLAGDEENQYKVLKTGAVTFDYFRGDDVKNLPLDYIPREEDRVKKGDLLISRMNTAELVGAVAYVWDVKPNIYLPDRLWRTSLTEAANPIFIWKALIQFDAKQQIRSLASGTSGTMKNISKPKLLSITIPKTSREKQDSFAQRLRAIQRQRNCIEESKKVAAVLFASRMDQYFNA